jgi:hypothetical protein
VIKLDIKSELPTAIKWTNEMTRQLPFSVSQALNAVAGNRAGINQFPEASSKGVLADLRRIVNRKLDRPKKQTAEGFFATTAKKTALFVKITPKNNKWDRNKYIQGNIKGGDRPSKWIENTARKLGSLPSNIDLVPTYNVKRDRYGNPNRTQIKKAFDQVGSGETFIGRPNGSQRPIGIYQRKGASLKALFIAQSSTSYPTPLQGLERMAMARAGRTFGPYLRRALEKNVRDNTRSLRRI